MSLPRPHSHSHSQSHSSSPSKSSLRSANSHSRPNSRGLLPSPKFDDIVRFHPNPSTSVAATASTASTAVQYKQQLREADENDEEAIVSSTQQAIEEGNEDEERRERESRSNFTPFFTLIADKTTGAHFHPAVHYVFADDDPELIATAACDQLARDETTSQEASSTRGVMGNSSKKGRQNEHVLILDVAPTIPSRSSTNPSSTSSSCQAAGDAEQLSSAPTQAPAPMPQLLPRGQGRGAPSLAYTVTSASSLSASWQVLSSEVTPAPTFDGILAGTALKDEEAEGGGGLMLKIEGTGVLGDGSDGGEGDGDAVGKAVRDRDRGKVEGIEEMVRRFEEGLDVVRRVLSSGQQPQPKDAG
ncbi:MAG: hypothetical protein Q9160_000291 [Pyrenula sp. 1 TL-2023]